MPDDEAYDSDGDVGRFLECSSPGGHMFPLSSGPGGGTLFHSHYGAPEHDEAPPPVIAGAEDHHQLPAGMDDDGVEDGQNQEMMAPGMQMHLPTINNNHEAPPAIIAEQHQEPAMDAEQYQFEEMAVDLHHMMMAQETQDPPPAINGANNHHEAMAMAMDVVPPAAETQAANGGFPNNPTTTPWLELEGSSMFPDPPSPTMCRMLDELAAMLQNDAAVEGAVEDGGGGAEPAADSDDDDDDEDVGPADDEVKFKPLTYGQLDCSRCHSVREVLAIDWPSKIHFAVHSTYPETFEHAVTHRSLMGEDGQFHTYALLYMDLRGRRNEWVEGFIAKSVDTMKRRNAGMVQDTNDPSTSNHGHMDLEVGMLNNLLSATTAATDQAANPQAAAQPVQEQGNTHAPPAAAQAQVHEEASSEAAAAVQPAVSQAQVNTTDALSVAEAAAPPGAALPQVPQVAATATSRAESRTDHALDRFPPFNWEGFKPDILESSQVEPYDPASGVNVLLYPSMLEQMQLEELKKKESKKLSKMTVEDTPDYLNINDDHHANAPNFASAAFKLLCQRDPTYRMFKRRVSGLNRKIKKLEQGANRVGTGGLFKIKQKMETCKQEKEELYDVIKRGMQEVENERRNNDGAGPSNHAAGPSNSSPGPFNGAGPSNVAGTSSNDTSLSDISGNSNNGAGPSNVAGTSNMDAAGPSSAADPSSVAGPSGTN